ncbi:MAG: hypothetical protein NTV01_03130 [Bacteroidia bacterium]|nr:hypothetical protein [Bacteroidia bacterium]
MTDKDIDLIIKFLENELSAQEVEEFKAKYGHDVEFTREVNERSKIYISLEAASKVSLKNMAEEPLLRRFIGNKTPPLNADYRISNKWLYRIAAVLIPLIALTIGMELWVRPRLSTDDLYLTYSQKLQAKGEFRSFTGDQKTNFGQLQKDIDNAILESIDALQGTADIHAFGLYCMEGKRFTEAVYAFIWHFFSQKDQRYYKLHDPPKRAAFVMVE